MPGFIVFIVLVVILAIIISKVKKVEKRKSITQNQQKNRQRLFILIRNLLWIVLLSLFMLPKKKRKTIRLPGL